jgi:hypothetical protein
MRGNFRTAKVTFFVNHMVIFPLFVGVAYAFTKKGGVLKRSPYWANLLTMRFFLMGSQEGGIWVI